jgi:hypothetical protein
LNAANASSPLLGQRRAMTGRLVRACNATPSIVKAE